jgi:hypothetical protein
MEATGNSSSRKTILVQILYSSSYPVYRSLAKLWVSNPRPPGIAIQFSASITDRFDTLIHEGDVPPIVGDLEDNLSSSLIERMLLGIEAFIGGDYDFLFKTNLSSLIVFPHLLKIVEDFSKEHFLYAGYIGSVFVKASEYSEKTALSFCSGAGTLITKSTARVILERSRTLERNLVDDVWLGYVLRDKTRIPLSRFDVTAFSRFDLPILKLVANHIIDKSIFHVRIKSSANREALDPAIYKYLLSRCLENKF